MTPSNQTLVGRTTELEQARHYLTASEPRHASAILITGEPGVGKSTLADAIRELATSMKWMEAKAECGYLESPPPFWPLQQIIRQLGIANRFEEAEAEEASIDSSNRFSLFRTIAFDFAQLLKERNLLITLEDIDAADESTKALLSYLLTELADRPLLVVATGNMPTVQGSPALSSCIRAMIRSGRCRMLELQGLSAPECRELASEIDGESLPEDSAEALFDLTAGNPFLLRALLNSGLDLDAGRLSVPGSHIPAEIRFALLEKYEELTVVAKKVLETAALIGRSFSESEVIASMAELEPLQVASSIDEGEAAGLIRSGRRVNERVEFVHELARQLLITQIPASEQLTAELKIATALESVYAHSIENQAASLARRFAAAAPLIGPDKSVHYALLAGQRSLKVHAYEEAVEHFSKALDARSEATGDRIQADLLTGLAFAELHLARNADERRRGFEHQRSAYAVLKAIGDDLGALRVAAIAEGSLAGAFWNLEFLTEAVESAAEIVRGTREYCKLLCRLGLAYGILKGDQHTATNYLDKASTIALGLNSPEAEVEVLMNRGSVVGFWHMNWLEGLPLSLKAANLTANSSPAIRALADVASLLIWTGDSLASEYIERFEQAAERLNDPTYLSLSTVSRCMLSLMQGGLDAVEEIYSKKSESELGLCQIEAIAAIVAMERGSADAGQERLDRMVALAARREQIAELDVAVAAITLAYCGRYFSMPNDNSLAIAWSRQVLESATATPIVKFAATGALVLMGEQLPKESLAVLGARRGSFVPFAPLAVDHLIGIATQSSGNKAASLQFFDAAVRLAKSQDMAMVEAYALVDRIQVNGKTDSRRSKRVREIAASISSAAVVERLLQVNVGSRLPGGLTPKEAEILAFLARGLTNQEIADKIHRTIYNVQSHAYNLYQKIGVSNRAAATLWAYEHGLT